jgi:hypothetical protein
MSGTWFTQKQCTLLEIKKSNSLKNNTKFTKEVSVKDPQFLSQLIKRIETLPSDGKMMAKIDGNSEYTKLIFYCTGGPREIEIIAGMIKTPSSGFNSSSETQTVILSDIDGLLDPKEGKILPKVKDFEFKFKNFTLLFKGTRQTEDKEAPISFSIDTFHITTKGHPDQVIEISSGQLAPKPAAFQVGKNKHKLKTFETNTGISLLPQHFQIVK